MIVQVFFLIKEIFEGEIVLDNTAGSMTTAIACINTNRRSICIEKDSKIFEGTYIQRNTNQKTK